MNITVVGAGYVGVSNAILLAQHNHVKILEINKNKIEKINNRESPIVDLDATEYLKNKNLNILATANKALAYEQAEYIIIATPTNYDEKLNFFDTSLVETAISEARKVNKKSTIVIKSTVPVGFTRRYQTISNDDNIIFSPEFLREGKALYDNLYPSRIVVGEKSKRGRKFANLLAQGAPKENIPIHLTGATEAESIKLYANTFLALRVAYFNELDNYALFHDLNVREIIDGVCADPRIGAYYNNPSFGYGGYCLPKDTKQLLANYNDSVPQNLIASVIAANSTRKDFLSNIIALKAPKTVGIYKLAMKSGSDNFRFSSILGIMKRLANKGITIWVYEPSVEDKQVFGFPLISNLKDFKNNSEIILCNRQSSELADVKSKVFTRDLFGDN